MGVTEVKPGQLERTEWLYDRTEVTLTVQDVANRLHQDIYGPESEHIGLHSCPCFLIARWNLGLDAKPNLYWPDGRGGNAHEPHPDPRVQLFHLKDTVIEKARAWNAINYRDKDACEQALSELGDAVDELEKFVAGQNAETSR